MSFYQSDGVRNFGLFRTSLEDKNNQKYEAIYCVRLGHFAKLIGEPTAV